METDNNKIVTNNFETQGSSTTQNKHIINPASTKNHLTKSRRPQLMMENHSAPEYVTFILVNLLWTNVNFIQTNFMNM